MAWAWYGKMKLLAGVGKYQPTWTSPCTGGATVDGKMEAAANGKYKPLPDAFGTCSAEDLAALSRYMYLDETSGKYKPHVVLNDENMCCPGDSCEDCEDAGDIFETTGTPYKVNAAVSGLVECPGQCAASYQNLNGNWTLTQYSETYPCIWTNYVEGEELDDGPKIRWMVYWGTPPYSYFHISYKTGSDIDYYFISGAEDECTSSFINQAAAAGCCAGEGYISGVPGDWRGEQVAYSVTGGGTAVVTWPV